MSTGRGITLNHTVNLITETCCSCGVLFAMPEELQQRLVENKGRSFYCPNGHSQSYVGESDKQRAERLAREVQAERSFATHLKDQLKAAERSNAALRGAATRTRKRIAAGVCPCCNRTFQNLGRHMAGQHPGYVDGGAS